MEKKFFRKMRRGASERGEREWLAILVHDSDEILFVPRNQTVRSFNDPDFESESVSVWRVEEREERRLYDIRRILEMDFGRYSPDFVPRYRRLDE
ncbi:MAG: hypothetical protein KC964_19210 [Candidatus Omnitrophica bacterium]|nr:hypothetical protein [Candidatus Omnitrophota bacterium]